MLEGVTARGIACSRRRLVSVFNAGGLRPSAGDEIQPGELEGRQIEVKLAHELWKDKIRLQITGYRSLVCFAGSDGAAIDEAEDSSAAVPSAKTPRSAPDGQA